MKFRPLFALLVAVCLLPSVAEAKKSTSSPKPSTTQTTKKASSPAPKKTNKSKTKSKSSSPAPKKTAKQVAGPTAAQRGTFIVISKRDLNLRVYGPQGRDTVLLAEFPVCLSRNKGNKQKKGDMRTPESPAGQPFSITSIEDSHTWKHDFKDGRGNILAYGHWFLRLRTPGHSGIGIHGSTNNEGSVPGRASEGCIRLRDADIITLKERYAYVGMPVIIKSENEGLYHWEQRLGPTHPDRH